MINFLGYHFKKIDFAIALLDIFVCSMGFFFYAWFGLGSSESTTPQSISPLLLSVTTGVILWGLLFGVGINSLPNVNNIFSFILKSIVAFIISVPVVLPLWWLSEFDYDRTVLLIIPALFIQIFILTVLKIVLLKSLSPKIFSENILVIANEEERIRIKDIIDISLQRYYVKRFLDSRLLKKFYITHKILFFCQKNKITKVVIGNINTRENIISLIELCYHGIKVVDIDLFQEQHIGKVNLKRFYNYNTLINLSFMPSRFHACIKRLIDVVISVSMVIFLSPVFCILAALIKLNDGGSVFYTQQRVGLNGKLFNILKFRSMRPDAEKNGVQWATQNDNRITKIGKFMRKTRLDEIPQLINILKNDMSIVGPRPERPEFVDELKKNIQYYTERHRIKPGLTGWAQINAGYVSSIDETVEKLEYDLYYLKYFNPTLDLLIILKTISVVLWHNHKVH